MFDIKRPTATVDIVTDLPALTQAISLKNSIDEATPKMAGLTDAEICAAKKSVDKLRRELKVLLKTVDESTYTFSLRGLTSSPWNQIVAANTVNDPKTGRLTIDVPGMLTDALPDMIIKVECCGKPVEFDPTQDVPALLEIVVDTQTSELAAAVQRLNTPQVAVPKALRE